MTDDELEARLAALEMLWASLLNRLAHATATPVDVLADIIAEEFDEARLDHGAIISPKTRAAFRQAARVARRR